MDIHTGDETESDDDLEENGNNLDPEWSCELSGLESSGSESDDDDNEKAEKRSRNHIR